MAGLLPGFPRSMCGRMYGFMELHRIAGPFLGASPESQGSRIRNIVTSTAQEAPHMGEELPICSVECL